MTPVTPKNRILVARSKIRKLNLDSSPEAGCSWDDEEDEDFPNEADDARLQELIKRWDAIEMLWSSALSSIYFR